MMRACFVSKNLIGDCLNIGPALRAWYAAHQDWEIDLVTLDDYVALLYERMGVPLRVITNTSQFEPVYDFRFEFDCCKAFTIGAQFQCHQAEAYARMLGVEIDSVRPVYEPVEDPAWLAEQLDGVILVSPFSRSCASQSGKPANKMLPWPKWRPVLRYLRSLDRPLRVLGAAGDRAPQLDLSEEEYLTGESLNRVALLMRDKAALLVGIDNGMGHLAASQCLPTFLLYPVCLSMHWIVPWGNPHVVPVQIDPMAVNPSALVWTARQAIPKLLSVRTKCSGCTKVIE